jgi:hypothetical protein
MKSIELWGYRHCVGVAAGQVYDVLVHCSGFKATEQVKSHSFLHQQLGSDSLKLAKSMRVD